MSPKPLSGEAFRDASQTGPRATYQIPNGGTFSVYASCNIAAPPQAVYDALLDVNKWPQWNTFVPKVDITGHPHPHGQNLKMMEGTNMTFHVQMTPAEKTTSKEACTHVEPLKLRTKHGSMARGKLAHQDSSTSREVLGKTPVTRIRWNLHNASIMAPGFLIKAERVNEIEEAEDGTTLYRTWQTFGGMAAKGVKKKYEQALKDRFQDWCRDLKRHVESKQAAGAGSNGEGGRQKSERVDSGGNVQQ